MGDLPGSKYFQLGCFGKRLKADMMAQNGEQKMKPRRYSLHLEKLERIGKVCISLWELSDPNTSASLS